VSDVVHVGERGLASAPDEVVLQLALDEGRVVLSRDQDFGSILAAQKLLAPSFVLLRPPTTNRTNELVELLRRVLDEAAEDLRVGAVVTVQGERFRTRRLPL
jgi:predicted nuclease of predicted toxin-antitoxin system